jgi:hypothetical protein
MALGGLRCGEHHGAESVDSYAEIMRSVPGRESNSVNARWPFSGSQVTEEC